MNKEDLVFIKDYIPNIYIYLPYATTNNFVHQKVYDFDNPKLRYGTVCKLKKVQEELNEKGYSLKILDGYRPLSVQFKFWEIYPDERFVANPIKGASNHCKGNAVDLTIVTLKGEEIKMPSKFDEFSDKAIRKYDWLDEETKNNILMLEDVMSKNGFDLYPHEWWHYNDQDDYPLIK